MFKIKDIKKGGHNTPQIIKNLGLYIARQLQK